MTSPYTPTVNRANELTAAFALARAVLRDERRRPTLALADDPLHLDFPPLHGSTGASTQTLRLTATLYLQSELEQAGLVVAAEGLAAARDLLQARTALATKLEDYAAAMHGAGASAWIDAARRGQLFARLFGANTAPANEGTNRGFEQLLAQLCVALVRVQSRSRWTPGPDYALDAGLRFAARALLLNVASRQFGVSSIVAARIDQQVRRSIALLDDPELASIVGVRGVWAVTRWLLGDHAPDSGRHAARAAAGQTLLMWLATAAPAIDNERATTPIVPRDPSVLSAAARWMVASGFAAPSGVAS